MAIRQDCYSSSTSCCFYKVWKLYEFRNLRKTNQRKLGVVFQRADSIPRHPTQLYEAFLYLLIFGVLITIYTRIGQKKHNGLLLGVCLILIFTARFLVEFFKENQVRFEELMILNMGQILSIPFIVIGLILIFLRKEYA